MDKKTQDALIAKMLERERFTGRIHVDRSTGKSVYKVGSMSFRTPREAAEYWQGMGISTVRTFSPSASLGMGPHVGPTSWDRLQRLAQELNLTVDRYSMKVGPGDSIERIRQGFMSGDTPMGLLLPDDGVVTGLRMFDAGGRELTRTEASAAFQSVFKIDTSSGKASKRIKSITNAYELRGDVPGLRVGVFDPLETSKGDRLLRNFMKGGMSRADAAKEVRKGWDGLSHAGPDLARSVADSLDEKAAQMLAGISATDLSQEAVRVRATAASITEKAKELRAVANSPTGGRFNIRALNFDLQGSIGGGEEVQKLLGIRGQVKGDIYIHPAKQWDRFRANMGAHFVDPENISIFTSVDAVTTQLEGKGRRVDHLSRTVGDVSLQPVHEQAKVWADIESVLSEPELFGDNAVLRETMGYVRQSAAEIRSGSLVDEYAQFLRDVQHDPNLLPKSGVLKELWKTSRSEGYFDDSGSFVQNLDQRKAASLLSDLELGIDPMQNPRFLGYFTTSLRKEIEATRKGFPRALSPTTLSAHVGNAWSLEMAGLGDVEEGTIRFVRGFGFAMNEADIARTFPAHGGFDLDDMIRQHLRWDRGSDSLIAVSKRIPTAYGEVSTFRIAEDDQTIDEVLKHYRGRYSEVDDYLTAESVLREDLRNAQRMRKAAQEAAGSDVAFSPEELRRAELAVAGAREKLTTFKAGRHDILRTILPGIDSSTIDAINARSVMSQNGLPNWVKYEPLDIAKDLRSSLLQDYFDEGLESTKNAYGVLGGFMNARMILDNVITTTIAERGDAIFRGMDDIVQVAAQEDVIDAMTQGAGRGAEMVQEMTANIYRGIGQILARGGRMDEGLRTIGRLTRSNEAIMMEVIKGINPNAELKDFLTQGAFSDYLRQVGDIHYMTGNVLSDIGRDAGIIPEIADEIFDPSEELEARRLMTTFEKAYEFAPTSFTDPVFASEQMDFFGMVLTDGDDVANRARFAQSEVVRTLLGNYTDDGGRLTEQGNRILGAFIQQYGTGRGDYDLFNGSMGDLFSHTMAQFRTGGGRPGFDMGLLGDLAPEGERDELLESMISGTMRDDLSPGAEYAARAKAAREAADSVLGGGARQAGERALPSITREGLADLWKSNKTLRRGALMIGGAVVFSEIYRHIKDRTPEDMAGPPLLPGGEFYAPQSRSMPSMEEISPQSSGTGVTYNVRARGNFSNDELTAAISAMTGAPVNSSSYESRGYRRNSSPIDDAINNSFG